MSTPAGHEHEEDLQQLLRQLLAAVSAIPPATTVACPTAFGTLKSLASLVGAKCWKYCQAPHEDHGGLIMPHAAVCVPAESHSVCKGEVHP